MGRYDMFVSYRRDNMGAAEYVYNQLTGQGYQVFLDVQALTAGRFMDEIRRGMEESELVLALLTEQSVQRMAKGPGDPVWQELDTVRQQNIPITFLWLSAGETEFQQVMAAHRDGDLLDWIAGHSVTPVDDLGPSLERAVTQIIQVLEDVRKRRLEAYRQSDTPEQEERFTGDDVTASSEDGAIHCSLKGSVSERTALLLDSMISGLQDIQQTYGNEYIRLTFKEV